MSAAEQIARQFANANLNKQTWGNLVVNVKTYGAKGDGTTDDTAAIQSCFNAAKQMCLDGGFYGITVMFPPGVYKITATITIPIYVNISGSGLNATIINALFNGDAFVGSSSAGSSQISYATFRDFCVNKSNTDGTSNTTGKIFNFYHNTQNCNFSNIRLNGGDTAFYFENIGYSIWNRFTNIIMVYQAIQSVYLGQGSNSTVFNTCIFNITPIGINSIGTSFGLSVVDCAFELVSTAAIQLENAGGFSVSGGYAEYNGTSMLIKLLGTGDVSVRGMFIQGNATSYAASVANAGGKVVFDGCHIENVSGTYPATGAFKQNVIFRDNQPAGTTSAIVRGYIDYTGTISTAALVAFTHNLGLPSASLRNQLFATPNSPSYMVGKEVEVSISAGQSANGYTVWCTDDNNIQVRTASGGGLIYDTGTSAYGNVGLSTSHSIRLRVNLA